ncbi:hypothetical protein [Coleofasciculus sp. H7-2]|uniref:hypothetical protein n=1 Tax=Coleofasciculus sp. H7-2 TaxID=3351545 RepID=UPI00366DD107
MQPESAIALLTGTIITKTYTAQSATVPRITIEVPEKLSEQLAQIGDRFPHSSAPIWGVRILVEVDQARFILNNLMGRLPSKEVYLTVFASPNCHD